MKFDDKFSERMLACRSQIGITQSELSTIIGVAQRMIAAYELGQSRPRMNVLLKLADTFGVSPDWLANGQETYDHPNAIVHETGRKIPLVKTGFVNKLIDKSLDKFFILEYVSVGFEVGVYAFAIRIEDDSMVSTEGNEHSFPRNSIVIFDPSIPAKGGDYVLTVFNDEKRKATFRRFHPSIDSLKFTPLNKDYPSDTLTRNDLREVSVRTVPAVGMIMTLPALTRVNTIENLAIKSAKLHKTSSKKQDHF